MRHPNDQPSAPDFTQACVVMFGVNLVWMLMVIWVVWGLAAVAVAGWLIARVIARLERARLG